MSRPGFLRNPMPPEPLKARGEIRCGSFMPVYRATPWRYTLAHDRDDSLLLWLTAGQGRAMIDGVRRGLARQTALFLPAGTLFSLDLPPSVQGLFASFPTGLATHAPQEPLILHIRDSISQAEITGEIDTMSREVAQGRPLMQESLETRVVLIGLWLARQVGLGAADKPPVSAAQQLARRYARALTRDYRRARPMAAYAEALDVTPAHLGRVCREACGKTAAGLLTERKLHAARVALQSPRPPIRTVAQELGFASPAAFSRFVVGHTGQTPSALRAAAKTVEAARSGASAR